jgi:hypothetical protein
MELTPRQYQALCAICNTFLPAAPGWPSAVERGVPAALATALDYNPRAVDRWEFLNLLDVWDSSLHSFVQVGSWSQFSKLPYEDQQKILLSWADSRLSLRRAAFQALRKGALDISLYPLSYAGGEVPETNIGLMPALVPVIVAVTVSVAVSEPSSTFSA